MMRVFHMVVMSVGLLSAPAFASDIDVAVGDIRVVQVLELPDAALIAGRPTLVKVSVEYFGEDLSEVGVDGVLRLFVEGSEDDQSPVYSVNGPIAVSSILEDATRSLELSFLCMPPTSQDVRFRVNVGLVNSFGGLLESTFGNNVAETPAHSFEEQGAMEVVYVPIDLRPGGGEVPNVPDPDLIRPGVGDNFVQGIFPSGSLDYRRSEAPSKLWEDEVDLPSGGPVVIAMGEALLSSLRQDYYLMAPRPDFIYGWVPGALSYNGQAFQPGVAGLGGAEPVRFQRTFAHELGHNFGRSHNLLEIAVSGVDVADHLNLPLGLPSEKPPELRDIMVPGLLSEEAWVAPVTQAAFFAHPVFSEAGAPAAPTNSEGQLLVNGTWDRDTGAIFLGHCVAIPVGAPLSTPAISNHDLVLHGLIGGQVVHETSIRARAGSADGTCCSTLPVLEDDESGEGSAEVGFGESRAQSSVDHAHVVDGRGVVPFVGLMPLRGISGAEIEALEVLVPGESVAPLARREASSHPPWVRWEAPLRWDKIGRWTSLKWVAGDPDGDAVRVTVRYSPDGGDRRVPLVVNLDGDQLDIDLLGYPHFAHGKGFFELLVSDGFRTTRLVSPPLAGPGAYASSGGNPPFIEIYNPDDGQSFRQGSKVLLQSSGWDLEDLALDGSSIRWVSDVDGFIGYGRSLLADDLSPGHHRITVVATDSAGLRTRRESRIEIEPRLLPAVGGGPCAVDLGFSGPGDIELTLCGSDLTQGGEADLVLTGASPHAATLIFLGFMSSPTPIKGGVLLPVPWTNVISLQANGNGDVVIPGVQGGKQPALFVAQAVVSDPGQALGYAFSNALLVEF